MSWNGLVAKLNQCNYVYCDGLALSIASYLTRTWPGDPLWLVIVAPPGSGKSCTLSLLSSLPQTELISSATPASFVTAFAKDNDPSIFARCDNYLLIFKDFGTILSQGYESVQAILSLLREAFDGHVGKEFAAVRREYDVHFNIIAGATESARFHMQLQQHLGERFLYYVLDPPELSWPLQEIQEEARNAVTEYVLDLEASVVELTQAEEDLILEDATLVAHLRTMLHHDQRSGEITNVPQTEKPIRLAKQLRKLYSGLYACTRDGEYSLKLTRRAALSTVPDRRLKILQVLLDHLSLTAYDICGILGLGSGVVRKELIGLKVLGILEDHREHTTDRTVYWVIPSEVMEELEVLVSAW